MRFHSDGGQGGGREEHTAASDGAVPYVAGSVGRRGVQHRCDGGEWHGGYGVQYSSTLVGEGLASVWSEAEDGAPVMSTGLRGHIRFLMLQTRRR